MRVSSIIQRIRQLLAELGPRRTALHIVRGLYRRIVPVRIPTHPFDLANAVDTSGLIVANRLRSGQPSDRYITAYWGIAPSAFAFILDRWSETLPQGAASVPAYVFLDIGCGKGRGLMLASDRPFREVLGVELNPVLISIAQRNLAVWKARPHVCELIEVIHADALQFSLPQLPLLLFVYNPFDANATQLLVNRLLALSRTRTTPIDILYVTPDHAGIFQQTSGLQVLYQGKAPFAAEDTAADAFQSRSLDFHIYRLPPLAESFL